MPDTATKPGQAQAQQVVTRPFITGTRRTDDFQYDNSTPTGASTVKLPTYELDTDGFTSGLYILCEAVTAGNAATVAFREDGPFIAYQTVQFSDTNNKAILGPISGHDLYVINKYGGYGFQDDARADGVFSATTGAGGTGGSFTFILKVPIEIVHRDALGALLNKSASAVFKMDLTLNTTANIYSTSPTNPPTVRTRIQQYGWMDSDMHDIKGNPSSPNPPALNTIQYWDKQSPSVLAGSVNQRLNTFTGLVRNLIFELRDSSDIRLTNEADFPDPFVLQIDKSQPINRLRNVWRHMIGEYFGYDQPVENATGKGRDAATYPEPYTLDFGLKPGAENRFGYLPVTSATTIIVKGTIGGSGAHKLNVFVNYVVPAGGDPKALTGGR
jgi:hypothetical protein